MHHRHQIQSATFQCQAMNSPPHYNDVIMSTIASQITSLTIVYSTVYSDADQRKHQSSASLAFFRGIHRGLVNSPHKWPVTRKMFPFDDVIMWIYIFVFTFRPLFYKRRLADVRAWINDRIHCFLWDVTIQPCPNFDDDSAKPQWTMTWISNYIHCFMYM